MANHYSLFFAPRPNSKPLGMGLPRTAWVRHNLFCNGVGRFWKVLVTSAQVGLDPTSICDCGTVNHSACNSEMPFTSSSQNMPWTAGAR